MIKVSNNQDNIKIINIHAPNKKPENISLQNLAIVVEDFNTPHSVKERIARRKN